MKQSYQLFLLLLCLITVSVAGAQTIYVKSNASGANNGSTWADAYTNLDAALSVAAPGTQIWVAAGTYKPSNPTPNNSFIVQSGVELYGGFAGTETTLAQRNYVTNITTLSGDISGNDVSGDFGTNRTDNTQHVVYVQNGNANNRSVIDGFRIVGGNTSNVAADPDLNQRGGGILAVAKLTVRNCTFTNNFGRSGGGIAAIAPAGSGLIVDNCIFDGNYSTSQCAGIYLRQVTAGEINRCIFRNNLTNRGCVYPETSTNVKIDSCLFEYNETGASQFGAAMFTWQSNFTLSNSIIRHNTASNAAGMYNDGREGISSFLVDNCIFDSNTVSSSAGTCLYNWIANFEVKNSQFNDNYAPSTGSAMYNRSCVANIHDCTFENGMAGPIGGPGGFGGAIANYSAGSNVTIQDCTFKNNKAGTSGGAVTVGFTASTTLKNCLFDQNSARFGGAVFNQNDSTTLNVDGCTFSENGADNIGGAINLSSGIHATINNSVFFSNSATTGGAIDISEDSLNLAVLDVQNTIFRDNFCLTQAGAININNADVNLTNCLFASNLNLGTGAGGVISNNASNDVGNGNPPVNNTSNIVAINCTFAANFGTLGAAIAQFENAGDATLSLQNTIFSSEVDNYAIEDGDPSVTSNGGNLCSDLSLLSYLTGTNDENGVDPLFVDVLAYDFHIPTNSPAIDIGNPSGAPATDIEGNPRVNEPDAGCYENQDVVGTISPTALPLQLMPNPAVDFVLLNIQDNRSGAVKVDIVTASGSLVRSVNTEKSAGDWQYRLDVKDLPFGTYVAKVRVGDMLYLGKIVKQ